ncbi:MAG TPA: hypothetical protein VIF62_11265 [Labilithrix sp.]|jgi:hypothetical protein
MKLSLIVATVSVAFLGCGGKILDQTAPAAGSETGTGVGGSMSGGGTGTGAAGTGTSAPASGPTGNVSCGSAACDVSAQECCITFNGGGNGAQSTCVARGKCTGDLVLACGSAKNCPSAEICCADLSGDTATATCQSTCGSDQGGSGGPGGDGQGGPGGDGQDGQTLQLCASDAECPSGQRCVKTDFGVSACQPRRHGP